MKRAGRAKPAAEEVHHEEVAKTTPSPAAASFPGIDRKARDEEIVHPVFQLVAGKVVAVNRREAYFLQSSPSWPGAEDIREHGKVVDALLKQGDEPLRVVVAG